nr:hypothetical protein BaRGS_006992 [Batillaria attramentaria]
MLKQVETFDEDHNLEKGQGEKSAKDDHNADLKSRDAGNDSSEYTDQKDSRGSNDVNDSGKSFEPFNLEVTRYEERVTDQLVKTFDEARCVFLFIQDGINYATSVYKLDGHCSDYIELIQDHSKAYKLLAFFELDMERQCRMHKRRVDMLLATLNEVNPQYYLLVCRQLIFEIAETYSSMLDIKLSMIELQGAQPTPHAVKKINHLAQQSIRQYEAYLDTMKGGKPDYPDTFPDGNTRPGLVAMFCIGRLWGKILTPDVGERLECMKKSLEHYKFVVDYCQRHPEAKVEVESELPLCQELSTLLPVKMEKIRAGVNI